jgi:TonB family protein
MSIEGRDASLPTVGDAQRKRARQELELAERWVRTDPAERKRVGIAVAAAVIVHAVVLVAQMPDWGRQPVRLETPVQQAMQVKFLPPPAPPKVERKPEPPKPKRVPRPDPTPDEPEPEVVPPPPAEEPAPVAPPQPAGPVRVAPGQGPGLIKRVEPEYPPMARAARMEGTVVLDAIIQKDGSVSDVKVVRSSNKLFEQPSIDAVRQWQFTPFQYDVVLTVSVTFVLR